MRHRHRTRAFFKLRFDNFFKVLVRKSFVAFEYARASIV